LLTFNDNVENIGGLSDAQLIENPLGRLDELDTLELRFAQSTIPVTTLNEQFVEDPERAADDLQNKTSPGDVWRIQGKDMASIADIVGQTPTSQLSPNFSQVRSKISEDILFRLGMPQYMRGGAGAADLATELALINQALQTRQGRRIKMLEDVIQNIAENTIGLFEEFLSPGDVLPLRLGRGEFLEVSRLHLQVRDPEIAEEAHRQNLPIEPPLAVDYEVVPFNPSANSKSAQLGRITQFMQLLINNPLIDQEKLMLKLLELLELGDEMLAYASNKYKLPLGCLPVQKHHNLPQIPWREAVFLLVSENLLRAQKLWELWLAAKVFLLPLPFRYNTLGVYYAYDIRWTASSLQRRLHESR
jgi:hypothetical protein